MAKSISWIPQGSRAVLCDEWMTTGKASRLFICPQRRLIKPKIDAK